MLLSKMIAKVSEIDIEIIRKISDIIDFLII